MIEATTIILQEERPQSWNTFWAGAHWRKRKAERDRVHLVVRASIDPDKATIYQGRVDIVITAFYDITGRKKQIDSPNVCNKPYIDALIGWYLTDDGTDFVRRVTTESLIDNDRPRVEIEIIPIGE